MLKRYLLTSVLRSAGAEPGGGGGAAPAPAPAPAPAGGTPPAAPAPAPAPGAAGGAAPQSPAPGAPPVADPGAQDPNKTAGPQSVVPENPADYKFELPPGMIVDEKGLEAFRPLAKELGLTQEAAQKIVALQAQTVQRGLEQHAAMVSGWAREAETDKEIGGPQFQQNVAIAQRGLNAVGSPALTEFLRDTGLGNHPELIRAFAKIGRLVGEGHQFPSKSAGSEGRSHAAVLYGGS